MNKVIITNARLTREPDLRFAAGSGTATTKFGIAVNRKFKKDESDFLNCIAFGKTAETIAQYFQKGDPINIEGTIRTGSYEKQDGTKVYTTDIVVESFEFVASSKKKNNNQDGFDGTEPDYSGDMPF